MSNFILKYHKVSAFTCPFTQAVRNTVENLTWQVLRLS